MKLDDDDDDDVLIHSITLTRVGVRVCSEYELFVREKLVQVERSQSLVQAQTLVIQSPLNIWLKL